MIKVTVLALATVITMSGCSNVSTPANEVAVHVAGYMMIPTDEKVVDCVKASTVQWDGPGDNYYKYPDGERTYKFAIDKDADGKPVSIIKGNIPLTITGVVSFKLNTDCDTLKKFHSLIGSKSWGGQPAYLNDGDAGWNVMLDTYIEQAIQSSATAASAQIKEDYLSIYNGAGRSALEAAMQKLLPVYVESLSGGKYFTDFRIAVNKPTIDRQDILDAIASKTVSELQNEAQIQKNTAVITEIQSIKNLVAVLGQQGYIDYVKNQLSKQQIDLLSQAITNGKVQILPVPTGSSMVIPTTK